MNHNAVELRRQNLVYFGVEWFVIEAKDFK
jgi:hypothetical protein